MDIVEFEFHCDASFLQFKFKHAVYLNVKYQTMNLNGDIITTVTQIGFSPGYLGFLDTDKHHRLIREIREAANNNAKQYWLAKAHEQANAA